MSEKQILFEKGAWGYGGISLVKTENTLLALVARGSKNLLSGDTFGYEEICARISRDGGATWSETQTVLAPPARQILLEEGSMKSAFFFHPCATVAANGDIVLLVSFFPESLGMTQEKMLDKKKTPYASFDGSTYPVIYDRDGGYYLVLSDGTVLNASKSKTPYTVKGFGDLYQGEEFLGNIYLNGAMGKSQNEQKTSFGAPLKAPKRSYVLALTSKDGGATWSAPADITAQVLCETDGVYLATKSGNATVTKSGRILVPMESSKGDACIYSDDNGVTWSRNRRLPYLPIKDAVCTVQAPADEIYFLGKNTAVSFDNGISWVKDKSKCPSQPVAVLADGEKVFLAHRTRAAARLAQGFVAYKKTAPKGIRWSKKELEPTDISLDNASLAKAGEHIAVLFHSIPNECIAFKITKI